VIAPERNLARLVDSLDKATTSGTLDREIDALVHDSRLVKPGALFVAVRGERVDGHAFVADALAKGAVAIVSETPVAAADGIARIVVPDARKALSRLAARFAGDPSAEMRVIGITGTNGKTTTTFLVQAILTAAGVPCARIGTLGASFDGSTWDLGNTTPLAPELHGLLASVCERGARAVAMEISSHALALDRVADLHVAVGVFTNLTRDHLDFHESIDAYASAKRSLFDMAPVAVLNVDDPYGALWASELADDRDVVTYGFAESADVRAADVLLAPNGSQFSVGGQAFSLRLPGRFNISNALAAIAVARSQGISDRDAAAALENVERVPGRMETVSAGGIDVIVDYAHTPDALERVLRTAREMARHELVAVFGCGGDRDRGKRPLMGAIAHDLAARVVVTSDNPRSEDPAAIAAEIVAGIANASGVEIELDRRLAIRMAIDDAQPGDVIVVAGKGHEHYQIIGDRVVHFDDTEEVRAALGSRA